MWSEGVESEISELRSFLECTKLWYIFCQVWPAVLTFLPPCPTGRCVRAKKEEAEARRKAESEACEKAEEERRRVEEA
jgi:hypothetical protein